MSGHDSHDEPHIVPDSLFWKVFGALIILTIVTVAIARVDFGALNLLIAMLIASMKAGLVAVFFMHLKYEDPLTWLYVLFPIFLLFIMIGGIFLDNPFRYAP